MTYEQTNTKMKQTSFCPKPKTSPLLSCLKLELRNKADPLILLHFADHRFFALFPFRYILNTTFFFNNWCNFKFVSLLSFNFKFSTRVMLTQILSSFGLGSVYYCYDLMDYPWFLFIYLFILIYIRYIRYIRYMPLQ